MEGKELALLEGMEMSGKSDLINDGKTVNSQLDYWRNGLKVQNQIWAVASDFKSRPN
ncbi:hypothetical protein ACNKHM_26355 [Shigella sonnei]